MITAWFERLFWPFKICKINVTGSVRNYRPGIYRYYSKCKDLLPWFYFSDTLKYFQDGPFNQHVFITSLWNKIKTRQKKLDKLCNPPTPSNPNVRRWTHMDTVGSWSEKIQWNLLLSPLKPGVQSEVICKYSHLKIFHCGMKLHCIVWIKE